MSSKIPSSKAGLINGLEDGHIPLILIMQVSEMGLCVKILAEKYGLFNPKTFR